MVPEWLMVVISNTLWFLQKTSWVIDHQPWHWLYSTVSAQYTLQYTVVTVKHYNIEHQGELHILYFRMEWFSIFLRFSKTCTLLSIRYIFRSFYFQGYSRHFLRPFDTLKRSNIKTWNIWNWSPTPICFNMEKILSSSKWLRPTVPTVVDNLGYR